MRHRDGIKRLATSIWITEDLKLKGEAQAKAERRTMSNLLCYLLEEYLAFVERQTQLDGTPDPHTLTERKEEEEQTRLQLDSRPQPASSSHPTQDPTPPLPHPFL